MKRKAIISFLLAALIYCIPIVLTAQTVTPSNPGPDPDSVDVPIDGGLSILLAAGVGYVAKKGIDKKKKDKALDDIKKW